MTKILIVDDNSDLERAFLIAAEIEKVDVVFCSSGAQALSLLDDRAINFDVGLIDLAMFPMDGFSLAKLIRSNEIVRGDKEMRLGLYTAQTVDDVVGEMMQEHRIERVFKKPIPPVELIREVKEWIH